MSGNVTQFGQRQINGIFSYSGMIAAPANQSYYLDLSLPAICVFSDITTQMDSGTVTLAVQLNGVSIVGLDALAVVAGKTTTPATVGDPTQVSAFGQILTLLFSAGAAPVNFRFSLHYTRRS